MPFFLFFYEKKKNSSSYANIFSKNVGTFSKNTLLLFLYFINKRVFSQIYMYFFLHFVLKKPLLSCRYLVKKRQFCQNCIILLAKKVNIISFFPISRKNTALIPIFFQKTINSKNTLMSFFFLF